MNTDVMFSRQSDEWETPKSFFDSLDAEFHFDLDAAATLENAKTPLFFTKDEDGLYAHWHDCGSVVWLNPPYSQVGEFIAKAAMEAIYGCTVVCLIPSRTDTRMWHAHIWDAETHQPRPGVEVRFIKGRLKFGGSQNSAPFPSCLVIFRPPGR